MKLKLATLILGSVMGFLIIAITLLYFQQRYLFQTDFSKLRMETESEAARIAEKDFTSTANTLAQLIETELRSMKTNALLLATDALLQLKRNESEPDQKVKDLLPLEIEGLRYSNPSEDVSFVFASSRSDLKGQAYRLIQFTDNSSHLMSVMKKQHPAYHLIYITTSNHMVRMYPKADMIEVVGTQSLRPDFDVSDFVFFAPAAPDQNPSGEFKWSPIYPAEMSTNWLLSAMQPINYQGIFLGAVTIDLKVPQLIDEARAQAKERGFDLLLLNTEGELFGSPGIHTDRVLDLSTGFEKLDVSRIKSIRLRDALGKIAAGEMKFSELTEDRIFLAAGDVPELGWRLILLTDKETFSALTTQLLQKAKSRLSSFFNKQLVSVAISLVLIFSVLTFILNFLVRPLRHIKDALRSIGKGDLEVRSSRQRVLEFQEMSEGVNQMAQKIMVNQIKLEHSAADAARGKLARQLAHDLRSPLSAIKISLRMMDEKCRADADLMNRAIMKMDQIIASLLPEKSGVRLRAPSAVSARDALEIIDLHQAIDEVIEQLNRSKAESGIRFERQYSPVTLIVQHRRLDLYRILVNIAQNAIESVPEGRSGVVKFVTQISSQAPDSVELRVQDNGRGIPPEIEKSIFQVNFTHGKKNGTGQGLAIVQDLVRKNGGQIHFESAVDQGTTFTLRYPMYSAENGKDLNKREMLGSEQRIVLSEQDQLVIIEDDPLVQDHWRILCKNLPRKTLFYSNWESLITDFPLHLTGRPVFIIDFHLYNSTLNGLEIYKKLSKDYPHSRFYMCSGELWDDNFRRQIEAISLPYISKPIPDNFELKSHSA